MPALERRACLRPNLVRSNLGRRTDLWDMLRLEVHSTLKESAIRRDLNLKFWANLAWL
jgi:hypothetical protein